MATVEVEPIGAVAVVFISEVIVEDVVAAVLHVDVENGKGAGRGSARFFLGGGGEKGE